MNQQPWEQSEWIEQTARMLDSYESLLGRSLIPRGVPEEDSRDLYFSPIVVVAHGTQDDPVLNYANQKALELWETDLETMLTMPSRKTAEPVHRDERAGLLKRVTEDGYIDDYSGVRISATGKRFRIHQAVVWNLYDSAGAYAGQAATFSEWEYLENA